MTLKELVEQLQLLLTPETENFKVMLKGDCWCCDKWEVSYIHTDHKEEYIGVE